MENKKRKVLIIVDMQKDFVYGPLGTDEAREIVPRVVEKLNKHDYEGSRIFFTKDTHDRDYLSTQEGAKLPIPHCIENTLGWYLIEPLSNFRPSYNVEFVYKNSFGCNYWHKFDFSDAESIELIGVCTDICVISNAFILKALYPEIPIIVDASCCAGSTSEKHLAALEVMKSCQIEVINERER